MFVLIYWSDKPSVTVLGLRITNIDTLTIKYFYLVKQRLGGRLLILCF